MMENKIEVGDYIRTKEFGIAKIIYQISEMGFGGRILEREYRIDRKEKGYGATYKEVSSKDILEHNENIKKLIKIGDYINGEKVTRIIPPDICGDEILEEVRIFTGEKEIYERDIVSILTKEQFENNEYKVGK